MLDSNDIRVSVKKRANCASSIQTLFHIQVRGWLVKHVHICFLHTAHGDSKALQFATRQVVHIAVQNVLQVACGNHLILVVTLQFTFKKLVDSSA